MERPRFRGREEPATGRHPPVVFDRNVDKQPDTIGYTNWAKSLFIDCFGAMERPSHLGNVPKAGPLTECLSRIGGGTRFSRGGRAEILGELGDLAVKCSSGLKGQDQTDIFAGRENKRLTGTFALHQWRHSHRNAKSTKCRDEAYPAK